MESIKYILLLSITVLIFSCGKQDYSPKPKGFYRINLPEKSYRKAALNCPYELEIPDYAKLANDEKNNKNRCWNNIEFPQFNATLHLSYFPIDSKATFQQLSEDARTFAFKHTPKATAIDQSTISIPAHDVYGIQYLIGGNTASNYQFFISDSSKHYLRGALYFNEKPHLDSIQPVLDFLKADIKHLIHSVKWK
ncbi:gliding motility lipoprotein GldD [Sphingobacteruim zhuxiongii]|uniref:gliding motility lipoprotein GldD n=1 Tax=Sphingobacterium zhuxiongii TaxID=2662364 RepID=UPI0019241A3D|nr:MULTISPECIES: gliding motility lipoprotein GldD [unclassified Sphingobacterium]